MSAEVFLAAGYAAFLGCGAFVLEWLSAHEADIVVLDQMMGDGLTGLETAKKLRKLRYDGPIVLFSAFLEPSLEKRLRRLKVLPVSKVDQTGKVTTLKWVTGLDAPKGTEIARPLFSQNRITGS